MKCSHSRYTNCRRCLAVGTVAILVTSSLTGCGGSYNDDDQVVVVTPPVAVQRTVKTGLDINNAGSPLLNLNPQGPGGAPNQSLRSGDVLRGGNGADVLIGGLGVDVLLGAGGDDVLVGGTEDFNSNVDGDSLGSDNRDRAFGGDGNDVFIWAPGDGSDFFDGGSGTDVIVFGILGELRDSDGTTVGAPFFNVNPPASAGGLDFDGVFVDPDSQLPVVRVSNSPGFCTVVDKSTNDRELDALQLDTLVRFSLREIANAFDAGSRNDDDGLRVAVSLRRTEYLVCTKRDRVDGAGLDNVEVLDLTTTPPTPASIDDLPPFVREQLI